MVQATTLDRANRGTTGVAFNNLQYGIENVRWIQRWPGRSQANENKVPSVLVYQYGQESPSAWGFQVDAQSQPAPSVTREWFKTLLDPEILRLENERNPSNPVTHDSVEKWTRDYLSKIYENVQERLQSELPGFKWSEGKIEFLFSVPTTWSPGLVERFKLLVVQAGFGNPRLPNHTLSVTLTEPEAAAVLTSTAASGLFRSGDVLVVCDAGGGTTDISALKVTDAAPDGLSSKQLRQLDIVSGENVGSAAIDYEFELMAREKLKKLQQHVETISDPEHMAWEMSKSRQFQDTKCDYGPRDASHTFSVPIPSLSSNYSNTESDVVNGHMLFQKDDLRKLFDARAEGIFCLIDNQLSKLSINLPCENVEHLILSGGLGQSPYMQHKLRQRYSQGLYTSQNARRVQVRVAPDPQLAVCKGLVIDWLRRLKSGEGVLGWRCCRASYGLICELLVLL